MEQEDKVATLEQCKMLVTLGIILNTENSWQSTFSGDNYHLVYPGKIIQHYLPKERYPAPDVAELGEVITYCLDEINIYIDKTSDGEYWLQINGPKAEKRGYEHETEAQARCAALIWLIENGHLNFGDLK